MKIFYISLFSITLFTWLFYHFKNIRTTTADSWHEVQASRQQTLIKLCQFKSREAYQEIHPNRFTYFVEKNLLWCRVFKAGTTTWLVTYFDLIANKTSGGPILTHFKISDVATYHSIQNNHPVSFAVVRHPFTRLVSAYQDKAVGGQYPQLKNKTFGQFLNLVIEQSENCSTIHSCESMDLHWRPYDQMCSFCRMKFSVISKLETFDEDREMILSMVGIAGERSKLHSVEEHGGRGVSTCQLTREYFADVPELVKEKLRNIFSLDFLMFDYDSFLY